MAPGQNQNKMQPQKRMKRKQKKHQPRRRQHRNLALSQMRDPNFPSDAFVTKAFPSILFCQGRTSLLFKAKTEAVFAQQCVLKTQEEQQKHYLCNYMSSQATLVAHDVPPETVWPSKPPMVRWPPAMYPQPLSGFANHLWQEEQQLFVLSNAIPSPPISAMGANDPCTLQAKDLHYEVLNEMVPRQLILCLFANELAMSPF